MLEQTQKILQGILQYCHPRKVLVYGEKYLLSSKQLKSIDICIVLAQADKPALLHKLYLNIASDIPFQLLLYTQEEWDKLTQDSASYASVIAGRGRVLYEQKS